MPSGLLKKSEIARFQKTVLDFYTDYYRPMPWRENTSPYYVYVSEIMLQQTQVDRVIPKFESFMMAFPSIKVLAGATFGEVLSQWQGLGYNRRAKWLHESAKKIDSEYEGEFPQTIEDLMLFKGIGYNTACAICVYSFNQPHVFIETNVRAVYIHHFFEDAKDVSDAELMPLVEMSLDRKHPREWYWALMDYGTYLKKKHKNPARRSKHHTKQSKFEGSARQVRGRILKALVGMYGGGGGDKKKGSKDNVYEFIVMKEHDLRSALLDLPNTQLNLYFENALQDLITEGLVVRDEKGEIKLA